MSEENMISELTIDRCRAIVAKEKRFESWYALTYSKKAFDSKQFLTTMSDKAAEMYAEQFKDRISELEKRNKELTEALKYIVETAGSRQECEYMAYQVLKQKGE